MAKAYLKKLSALVDEITSEAFDGVYLECKHFFSGAALYVDDRICISWTPVGLAFKLPQATLDQLLNNGGAKPLKYFPKSPIKQGYALFPDPQKKNPLVWKKHINDSINYALTLPKPVKKRKPNKLKP